MIISTNSSTIIIGSVWSDVRLRLLFLCVIRTLEQAASVPVVYATAYYSLVVRGRLRPGESVLIHSGSGGVGQAAIAIALSMNCRVFTTVGQYTAGGLHSFVISDKLI